MTHYQLVNGDKRELSDSEVYWAVIGWIPGSLLNAHNSVDSE